MCVFCFRGNKKSIRRIAAGVALTGGLLLGRSLLAQEAPSAPTPQPAAAAQTSRGETFGGLNYLNGYSFLKGPVAPYKTRTVPAPNLSNSPRMDQLVRDGKIYLSMSDAIALALENNLDLAIARYNLPIADTDILRAKAGQGLRGVATGLVQGTPGGQGGTGTGTGSQGAGAGGTTSAAGGAATGTSGIVRNDREIADVSFRNHVIETVSQIQNIYWDLVSAYENVTAKERAVTLAQKTLSDNQKQVQIGTLAPIEVVRAQSTVAANQQTLIVAQTNLQLQQLLMKNALSRSLSDPILAAAPVIPTDVMAVPAEEPVTPTQDLINDALSHRADLAQSRIDLTNREINRKAAINSLLPSVDLVAFYGASGLGGTQNSLAACGSAGSSVFCTPAGTVATHGYGDTFGNLFNSSAPDKGMGLQVNIPIRNRSAQADQMRSELELRQAEMRIQQLQNQVAIQVRNAQFAVQQNRAQVEAAEKALELAQQSLEAEQKKYALGASTNFAVLQTESDLATADSNRVQARSAYAKSRVELDRVTGYTLVRNGIVLDDAFNGTVTKQPVVPYVMPRTDTTPTQQQQAPQGAVQNPGAPR